MASIRNDWSGASLAGGRYIVSDRLGRGGMGTVYRARDTRLLADVVVKVPHGAMLEDEGFAGRFEAEIHTLAQLSHPQIVKVTDVDRHDGVPFFVMQYLPGGSLDDRRRAGSGPDAFPVILDPRDLSTWLPGIAGALDYLHERGYVHRDVKPANILFDARGNPFLSDFGVIKVLASAEAEISRRAQTGAGMVLGTAEYMAPEQVMGEAIDGKADQYALAVSVYEMLTGRRPFEDATTTKLFVMQIKDEPPPPEALVPWIPPEVSRAVLRGLSKDRGQRYPSCADLAAAIRDAVASAMAEKPDRVRFRCPSCERSLSLGSEKFALLRQKPRTFPCPNCQQVIRGEKTVAFQSAGTSGTLTISTTSFAAVPEPNRTAVERPGTLVERAGTLVERPGTIVERAGTLIEAPAAIGPATLLEPAPAVPTVGPDAAKWASPQLLAVGGGAIVLTGIAIGAVLSRGGATEPPSPRAPLAVAAATPTPAPASAMPTPAPKAEPRPEPEPAKVEPAKVTTSPKPAPKPKPAAAVANASTPAPAEKIGPPPAPPRVFQKYPNPVALKDVMSSPGRFDGSEVELLHLYLIEKVGRSGSSPDATRTLAFSEPKLNIHKSEGLLGAEAIERTRVTHEIDPVLAAQLDEMRRPSFLENLAVPTVRVEKATGDQPPRLRVVRLEFLRAYRPNIYRGGYKPDLRLEYDTLILEPGRAREASGDRGLWTKVQRLGFLEDGLSKNFDRNRTLRVKAINLSIAAAQNAIASKAVQAEFQRQAALAEGAKRFMMGR